MIGYPALFIIGKDGTIIYKSSGYEEGKEDKYLEKLLEYFNSKSIAYKDFKYEKQQLLDVKENTVTIDF